MSGSTSYIDIIQSLSKKHGFFNPFSIINGETASFIGGILGKMYIFSFAAFGLVLIIKFISFSIENVDGRDPEGVIRIFTQAAIVLLLMIGYPVVAPLAPKVLHESGKYLYSTSEQGLNESIGADLMGIGEEQSSDFGFLSGSTLEMPVAAVIAAFTCTIAIVIIWFMSMIQPFIFTLWYVIGPIMLPLLLTRGSRDIAFRWYMSMVAVSFWSVAAAVFVKIIVGMDFLGKSYHTGAAGHFILSIIYSIIIIITIIGIPALTINLFGGVGFSVLSPIIRASKSGSQTAAVVSGVGTAAVATGSAMKKLGGLAHGNSKLSQLAGNAISKGGSGLQSLGNYARGRHYTPKGLG